MNNLFFQLKCSENNKIPNYIWDGIDQVWDVLLETYRKNPQTMNLIFTNALFKEEEESHTFYNRIKKFANDIDSDFYPVILSCDWEQHKLRVDNKDRADKFKITCLELAKNMRNKYQVLIPEHINTLQIDNSYKTPKETADLIITKNDLK